MIAARTPGLRRGMAGLALSPGRSARLALSLLALALSLVALPASAAHAQRVVVMGRVSVKDAGTPLGYAVVSTTQGTREVFANSDGYYVLRGLPAGRLALTAKRIGYTPLDTVLDAARADDTLRVDLALALATVRLPAIHSFANGCAHPGPDAQRYGLELAALFEQMQQNAERSRLLARDYPFELQLERRISRPEPALEARFVAFDTIVRSSVRGWRYAPGHLMGVRDYDPGVFGGRWTTLTLPELADYADPRFLEAHCFDFAGVEVMNGDSLLRIDFSPVPGIHEPDIAGSLLLETSTFHLRSTLVTLVNLTSAMRKQISGQSIKADFKEVVPGVPVVDRISSVVYPLDDPKAPTGEPMTETQRTLSIRFLHGKP